MGTSKDLGTGIVHDICEITGYPQTKHGHLLDPLSMRDGLPIRKQPWLPDKPKKSVKCPKCKGTGLITVYCLPYSSDDVMCNRCGGKGYK